MNKLETVWEWETGCDETTVSVLRNGEVLSDVIWSQSIHEEFGGVVPELASRAHVDKVVTCTEVALAEAGIERPDLVCATAGPGWLVLCWSDSALQNHWRLGTRCHLLVSII